MRSTLSSLLIYLILWGCLSKKETSFAEMGDSLFKTKSEGLGVKELGCLNKALLSMWNLLLATEKGLFGIRSLRLNLRNKREGGALVK